MSYNTVFKAKSKKNNTLGQNEKDYNKKSNIFKGNNYHLAWSRSSFIIVICQRQIGNHYEVLSFYKIYIPIAYETVFDIVEFFALCNWRVLLNNKRLFLYGLLPLICVINFCKWQFKVKTVNTINAITTNAWIILNVAAELYDLI